jgi:hypothetical protein
MAGRRKRDRADHATVTRLQARARGAKKFKDLRKLCTGARAANGRSGPLRRRFDSAGTPSLSNINDSLLSSTR